MATLLATLGIKAGANVILVGKPEITNTRSVELNEPYYLVKLKELAKVTCSTDPLIESYETDEVYVRESDLNREEWQFVDKDKPEEGYFMKGWVIDYSKSQKIPIYQETTIRSWVRDSRRMRSSQNREEINKMIRAKIEANKENS